MSGSCCPARQQDAKAAAFREVQAPAFEGPIVTPAPSVAALSMIRLIDTGKRQTSAIDYAQKAPQPLFHATAGTTREKSRPPSPCTAIYNVMAEILALKAT